MIRSSRAQRYSRRLRHATHLTAPYMYARRHCRSNAPGGHLCAFTPARTLVWQRSNSHAKTHTCVRVRSICAAGSAASTTRSAATRLPGSCPLTLLTKLFAVRYLHRACNMPKPMPTHLRQAGHPHRKWMDSANITPGSMAADLGEEVTVHK